MYYSSIINMITIHVPLQEESAKILSSGTDILSSQTRSCKDESFLPTDALSLRIREVGT